MFLAKLQKVQTYPLLKDHTLETRQKEKLKTPPFVTTYTSWIPRLKSLVHTHWNIIRQDTHLSKAFEEPPLTALKNNKNIAKYLICADLKHLIKLTVDLTLDYRTMTLQTFAPPVHILNVPSAPTLHQQQLSTVQLQRGIHYSCTTRGVIYLIICNTCKKQYAGQMVKTLDTDFGTTETT